MDKIAQLVEFAQRYNIPHRDICIVGGLSLELQGIRSANDIDILINPTHPIRSQALKKRTRRFPWSAYKKSIVLEEVDIHINRFSGIGWTDEQVFANPQNTFEHKGFRVIRQEIECLDRVIIKPHKRLQDASTIFENSRQNWDNILFMNLLIHWQKEQLKSK